MSDDNPLARRRAGGLGRGLSALLGDVERDAPRAAESATPANGDVRLIAVADIRVHPQQPRRYFD